MATPGRSTATPVRAGRMRARASGALPALTTRQSSAYGSQGKVSLHTQVATSATDFARVFESATSRAAAVSVRSKEAHQNGSRLTSQPPEAVAKDISNEDYDYDDEEPSLDQENESHDVDDLLRPNVIITNDQPRSRSPTFVDGFADYADPSPHRDANVEEDGHEPHSYRIFMRTLPRYIPRLLADVSVVDVLSLLGFIFLLTSFAAFVPLPEQVAPVRQRFFDGMKYSIGLSNQHTTLPPWDPAHRIDAVEHKISHLQKQYGLHQGSITELRKVLPDGIALRKVNGEWDIPSDFWRALTEKMSKDQLGPLWDRFLAVNNEKITSLLRSDGSSDTTGSGSNHQYVSRDEFLQTIARTSKTLEDTYKELLRQGHESILREAKKVSKLFSRTDARSEISELSYKALLVNTDRALHEVNYFSVGLGAIVDPKLTSPTFRPKQHSWIQHAWAALAGYEPHPPVEALRGWEEATDCWCASFTSEATGKAQIAVKLSSRIFPELLVVEHIPPQGTRTISAAPKDLEIWAELASHTDAMRTRRRMRSTIPLYDDYKCGTPPSANYVCIGVGTYDIEFQNHVQTFPVFANTKDLGFHTDKIVVRASSNWGASWTCLYRIRMIGEEIQRV